MSARHDVDRQIATWLRGERPTGAPDALLEDIERQVGRTARRPGWQVVDYWTWRHEARLRLAARTVVLTAIVFALVLLSALVVGLVGSPQPAPPFGLTRAGLIAVDTAEGIVVARADGTERRVLVPADGQSVSPTWSRDGLQLAFWHRSDSGLPWSLVVVDADGAGQRILADGVTLQEREEALAQPSNLSWSPDSRQIVYAADAAGGSSLFIAPLGAPGTASPLRITDPALQAIDPAWSPTGREIAFQSQATSTLHLVAPDGANPRRLSSLTETALWPDWSPDGSRLATMAIVDGQFDIFIVSADGSVVTNASHDASDEFSPTWSPDGSRLAWARTPVDRSARAWVVVSEPDGPYLTEIREPADLAPPVWSPDGSRLYSYVQADDGTFQELVVIDPTGRVPIQRMPVDGNLGNGNWQRLPRRRSHAPAQDRG